MIKKIAITSDLDNVSLYNYFIMLPDTLKKVAEKVDSDVLELWELIQVGAEELDKDQVKLLKKIHKTYTGVKNNG